jgi:hypothetical protein
VGLVFVLITNIQFINQLKKTCYCVVAETPAVFWESACELFMVETLYLLYVFHAGDKAWLRV